MCMRCTSPYRGLGTIDGRNSTYTEEISMKGTMRAMWILLAVGLLLATSVESSHALPGFGTNTDVACQAFNGTTPYADKSCALCHTSNSPYKGDLNQNGQFYKGNNLTAICPV